MSKTLFFIICTFISTSCLSQNNTNVKPRVQDLDFLVGSWQIEFEIYDTERPERGVIITETGTQECTYDLALNGTPMFITCIGQMTSDKGRKRTFRESIRYSQFSQSFERIGLYSNWPATGLELLAYYPKEKKMVTRGELGIQHGRLERYEDVYQFNDDHTSYSRINMANFSNMPMTEFNLTLKGRGKKVLE